MKTQKSNSRDSYLQPRKNRWKWMAGASAAVAAGVTTSKAGAITITLVNNYISSLGGNHLNADLTGDGQPDLAITGAAAFHSIRRICSSCSPFTLAVAQAHLNGVLAYARLDADNIEAFVILGSQFRSIGIGRTPGSVYFGSSLTGSIPISFKDLHINGGALTQGSLEVTVSTAFLGDPKIQLDSFTYNTRENVPDQGSSLVLLAMGATGILALRRWRAAQARS